MRRKYYNDIYFTLSQIDNPDELSATLFTCMKMWTDEHDVDFLPWFLQFVKDSYAVETGRDFYKDTFNPNEKEDDKGKKKKKKTEWKKSSKHF